MQNDLSRFWLTWTLATLAGYTLGLLAILNWVVRLAYAEQPPWLIGFAAGAVLGAVLGAAQGLVLRRYTPVTVQWVLASIVGGALGLALGMPLADTLTLPAEATMRGAATPAFPWQAAVQTSVTGAVVGVILGGAQWLLVRDRLGASGWWILVSALGWMAGLGLGAATVQAAGLIGAVLVSGFTGGVITGWGMQRWLQQAPLRDAR
jgi:hypothetical protein